MTVAEAILEPDLPIIDPHHHLWDRQVSPPDPSVPEHGYAATVRLSPRYLLDELLGIRARATTSSPPCSSSAGPCIAPTARIS